MATAALLQTISKTMDELLGGYAISHIDIPYQKCANLDEYSFNKKTCGSRILGVYTRDGWIVVKLSNAHSILINLGFNANVLFFEAGAETSKKFDVRMQLEGGSSCTIKYWMGGRFYLSSDDALPASLRAREYMRQVFEQRQRLPCHSRQMPSTGKGK